MNIIEFIKSNPDYTKLTKAELSNLLNSAKSELTVQKYVADDSKVTSDDFTKILSMAYAELEIQKSANNNNKIKINAGYGILSNKRCRWKKHVNAEAITSCGQLCVRGVANYVVKKANENSPVLNLYTDTDSVADTFLNTSTGTILLSELWDNHTKNKIQYSLDKWIGKCDETIPTINSDTGEIELSGVKYLCKHKVKKRMFRIKYMNKEIIVTEDHSIMVCRLGKIISIKPTQITKEDRIIIM